MFELRDKIRELDVATDMKFDLLGLYEMSELTDAEKKLMATIIHNAENEEKAAEEVFEILNAPNAVNMDEDCDSTLTEDVKEEIQDGDEIVYNGEHLFVANADYMDLGKWLWVTDNEEDRYNKKAPGWSLDKELVDEVIGQPDEEELDESLKDFMFTVKCNDGPKELIKVVAEDKAKAEEYAKKMYAQNHTTYADDRHNVWSIDEDLSSDIDKVKYAVDRFKGQVTVSKDSENDVGQYLLSKNISYMKDDSKSAKGKLTFMLKYPIPKLLNKNENLSGNCLDEAMDSSKFDKLLDKAFEFGYNYGYSDTFEDFMKKVKPNVKQSLTKDMLIRLKDAFDNGNHEGDVDEEMPLTEGAEGYYKFEIDGLENATQEYTSANTSINSAKLPAIFSMVNFKPETINLDYGGGNFDNATTALEGKGVTNLIYDPYNRSSGHNKDVIDTVRKNGGADTVTCSNVLNVIKEPEARKAAIKNIYSLLKNSGTAYFTVYEGTGKGNEGPTKSGYQLNKKTGDYVEEISSVFPSVSRRGKLIIASKGASITEEFDDDWSDTLETGGEPTYCPDCGVKFVRDEEGDAICPKCNKTPYQLANERRKNESLNKNELEELFKLCNQLGIYTLGDLELFMKNEGKGKAILSALKDYLFFEIGDPNFQAKDESLKESKADIDNFINKFGEDTYELFKKSAQRLKNKGISTDLTYHVKNTDKKDLDAILLNLQNRAITKDDSLTELAGDYKYLGEGKGYKVYKINDVIASINFGAGTGWCISGRYGHYGEKNYKPTKAEAEKHWNDYTSRGVQFYFFIGTKDKVALALYPNTFTPDITTSNIFVNKTNCEIYNERDKLDYSLLSSLPVDLINEHIIVEGIQGENGLYIKDNILFKCNRNKKNAVIPNGITKITDKAFASCKQLKTVTIPNSVTSIGNEAFSECNSLTSITIGSSVKSIGNEAFWNCSSLTSITIPDSVTSIGDYAFTHCSSLTSITIPNSVTNIGNWAFYDCISLTSITLSNSVKSIGDGAFEYCSSLTSITIPNSVMSIGKYAFEDCSSLTSITIPNGVTSIGDRAFSRCSSLTSITIPDSVMSIGKYAFENCSSLTSITIPNSVTSIGENAFKNCTKLKNIMYKGTIAEWKDTLQWRGWDEEVPKSCTIHCTDGDISLSGKKETAKSAKDELLKESDDPHYLKEAKEKLTTYYQIWAKGPSDSKFHFQDEYEYLSDLVEEAKGFMHGNAQVRVLEVEEDESGNVVKRNGEVLFYSDGAVQTVDKELFDVATPQETADMFGKKVYSKKENKLYTPTGPVFEAAKSSPEQKVERELKKLDNTKDESLKEDNDAEEWEEVASKSVEDSDGFLTDYVWYTDGNKHVFIFGDSDIYRPEDGYFDWEIDIVEGKEAEAYKEAQDWFNSYNGFAEELDEAQDIYDIQGQAVRDARRKEVLDEFKEIFTDEPGEINLDNEETLAIVRGYLEDMGYVVEVSETQNASHPIHIEWFK